MDIVTAVTIVVIVAVVGFFLTSAYIVRRTGSTAGISDLARGTADILRAGFNGGGLDDD